MGNISFLTKNNLNYKSKKIVYQEAFSFLDKRSKDIYIEDFNLANNVLKEIEEWELKYSKKDYSVLKNNSVLTAYLAYKFGLSIGLNKQELSDLYISALVQNIGKVYMCDEDKEKAYTFLTSSLTPKEKGFEEIAEALKKYPIHTKEYLKRNGEFNERIIDTAVNYHSVYSHLFKDGYPSLSQSVSQLESILWLAESLTAISFSNIPELQRNYTKGKDISLFKGFEILRKETEDKNPIFWKNTPNTLLAGVLLSLSLTGALPSKSRAANFTSEEVVALVNEYRESEGRDSLKSNERLVEAAMQKAKDMLEKGYWNHYGPSGESPWQFVKGNGYEYMYAGENLAKGFKDSKKMLNAWKESPKHNKNLLKEEYEDIGIAVVDGNMNGKSVTLVVQIFGKEKEEEKENDIIESIMNFFEKIGKIYRK